MEVNAIRETMHVRPFQPFRLRLADGRELIIRHPDFIAVAPNGRRVVVFDQEDAMSVLEPLLIVSIEAAASGSGKQSGNGPPAGPADAPA